MTHGVDSPHVQLGFRSQRLTSSGRGGSWRARRVKRNRQNSTRRVVRTEPVGVVDGQQLREPRAGTMDSALDRPYRGLADRSRLVVGKARRADQKQGLALDGRQLCKRVAEIFEFHPAVL